MTTSASSVLSTHPRCRLRGNRRKSKSTSALQARPYTANQRVAPRVGQGPHWISLLAFKHPGPSELMPLRLTLLHLDPGYLRLARTATFAELERVCASCKAWRLCKNDLERGDYETGMGSYCLNAMTIDNLVVER